MIAANKLLKLRNINGFGQRSIVSFFRAQSSLPKSSEPTHPPPPPPPNLTNKSRILVVAGALAIGSTLALIFYSKDSPQSSHESPTKTSPKPAFEKGSISVIFVLGGPGVGKGTQCARLVKDGGFIHLSAGDLLRAEQNRKGSEYGDLIARCIKEGTIVPQEVTLALLEAEIKVKFASGFKRFLIDGFPRKMDQALSFEDKIATSAFTLFFDCPEKIMLERLLGRAKTSGRADDNIESIKKRFKTFTDTSMPVVEYFEKQNKVVKVRCDQPVDKVYQQVTEAIEAKGV